MLVNRLEERADQLRQEINMYKMQSRAQESETSAIRSQITEAKTEIETIGEFWNFFDEFIINLKITFVLWWHHKRALSSDDVMNEILCILTS